MRLVDWADEEGFRFGRSLFGSSAASGSLDPDEFRDLRDAEGASLPDVLARHGVDLDRALEARRQLANAAAYLELHIEQGPVLERLDLPLAVVLGTYGVERHVVRFRGQRAHAGATPMDMRRDPVAAAARFLLEGRRIANEAESVTTVGTISAPGGHRDRGRLRLRAVIRPAQPRRRRRCRRWWRRRRSASERIAAEEGVRGRVGRAVAASRLGRSTLS